MASASYTWSSRFLRLFDQCVAKFRSGDKDFNGYYREEEQDFLRSIGCKPREFFDFVEDFVNYGEPGPETALLVAAVRRDYLEVIQGGRFSSHVVTPDQLPPKPQEVEGIPWLPRIIAKARAKLRGEMDPEIMYGCGGDRRFLSERDIHPADFLRVVWAAGDDDAKIIEYVKKHAAA